MRLQRREASMHCPSCHACMCDALQCHLCEIGILVCGKAHLHIRRLLQDKNEQLDEKELHICLLILYDKLNDKLPCHLRVPRAEEVHELYIRHAPEPGASLDRQQFLAVAGDLFASTEKWWDSVLIKVAVTAGLQLALFPLIGALI
jgi:hypothetical protein